MTHAATAANSRQKTVKIAGSSLVFRGFGSTFLYRRFRRSLPATHPWVRESKRFGKEVQAWKLRLRAPDRRGGVSKASSPFRPATISCLVGGDPVRSPRGKERSDAWSTDSDPSPPDASCNARRCKRSGLRNLNCLAVRDGSSRWLENAFFQSIARRPRSFSQGRRWSTGRHPLVFGGRSEIKLAGPLFFSRRARSRGGR